MSPLAPFGTWESRFEVAEVAAQRLSRSGLASDGAALWWLEARPADGGRTVLVRTVPGEDPEVVSPPGASIRSRVHEYGGGAWCLLAEPGAFAYVEQTTQRVMAARPGRAPVEVTAAPPDGEAWHHGGLVVGPAGSVLAIRERLHPGGVERSVVRLDPTNPARESVVCKGRDFYGSLAPSPDGTRLAWVTWDHPDMPWDATELWVGELALAGVELAGRPRRVGAGPLDGASVDQPLWLDDGTLAFIADPRGWWQPWRWRRGRGARTVERPRGRLPGPGLDARPAHHRPGRGGGDRVRMAERRSRPPRGDRRAGPAPGAAPALCGHRPRCAGTPGAWPGWGAPPQRRARCGGRAPAEPTRRPGWPDPRPRWPTTTSRWPRPSPSRPPRATTSTRSSTRPGWPGGGAPPPTPRP